MNLVEINRLKEKLVNSIIPLLDDLRDESKKVFNICASFVITTNDEIECMRLVMDEICSSNSDIRGRIDVFDNLEFSIVDGISVGGITLLLFLDKDKDRFDHPDINRFYAEYPEFFTGNFDEDDNDSNQFIGDLLSTIVAVKEKSAHFGRIESKSTDIHIFLKLLRVI